MPPEPILASAATFFSVIRHAGIRQMDHLPSTFNAPQSAQLLINLDCEQDDVLRQLDELNHRIEQAIVTGQMSIRTPSEQQRG